MNDEARHYSDNHHGSRHGFNDKDSKHQLGGHDMTIATVIDEINDKLAGSDQPSAQTIEGALQLLLENVTSGGGGGGGGGALVCNVTIDSLADPPTATLDKKTSEILAALNDGMVVWFKTEYDEPESITSLMYTYGITDSGRYEFGDASRSYYADTENDYPVAQL